MDAEITIRNYRCFTSERPVKLLLRTGETAFVGVNNSGKSTLLRFFFELRDLFARLAQNPAELNNAIKGSWVSFNINWPSMYPGMNTMNIYNNNNDDIEILIKTSADPYRAVTAPVLFEPNKHFELREFGRVLGK
jgi:AAA15 family ATPase/GTPase